jgi:hypothetical protein
VNSLEKWLNLLEGYFSMHNFPEKEKITFTLLKSIAHVKHSWETYCEKISTEDFGMFEAKPTWESFVDVVREQYYRVGNYEDQYMRWTKLCQERGQVVLDFTNTFHTLHTNLCIKNFEHHLVIKFVGLYIDTSKLKWSF